MRWFEGCVYLWDCKTGNGETGEEVTSKLAGGVGWDPVEDGEEKFQAKEDFGAAALPFELIHRGVIEERLLYPIPNLLHNAAFRRHHHLVHQRHLLAALTAAVIRVCSHHVIPWWSPPVHHHHHHHHQQQQQQQQIPTIHHHYIQCFRRAGSDRNGIHTQVSYTKRRGRSHHHGLIWRKWLVHLDKVVHKLPSALT